MIPKIEKGFDRDIDYIPMKKNLINEYLIHQNIYLDKENNILAGKRIIFLLISMIQLRNGSRISEAIDAFRIFLKEGYKNKVFVKIAKSGATKYITNKNGLREKIITTERFRKIMFPISWIDTSKLDLIIPKLKESHEYLINTKNIKINIFSYLHKRFNCNTHSLRYAFINYMIYQEKRPLCDVAKFVGHKNMNQLVTYTQHKNCDQIFDLDI
jgi:hypothetical protein